MADVREQEKSYPKSILELNKDTSDEKIQQTFDQWADTYEEVSLTLTSKRQFISKKKNNRKPFIAVVAYPDLQVSGREGGGGALGR